MFQCFEALLLLRTSKRREEKEREASITFYTILVEEFDVLKMYFLDLYHNEQMLCMSMHRQPNRLQDVVQ